MEGNGRGIGKQQGPGLIELLLHSGDTAVADALLHHFGSGDDVDAAMTRHVRALLEAAGVTSAEEGSPYTTASASLRSRRRSPRPVWKFGSTPWVRRDNRVSGRASQRTARLDRQPKALRRACRRPVFYSVTSAR